LRLAKVFVFVTGCSGSPSTPGDTGVPPLITSTGLGCENPVPILLSSGDPSGFLRCLDGSMHRQSVVAPGLYVVTEETCSYSYTQDIGCLVDADCTERPNGMCLVQGGDGAVCDCKYACASDADCDPGTVCVPPEIWEPLPSFAQCVQAGCITDADCPSGECGVATYDDGCGAGASLGCRAADDVCRLDVDCDEAVDGGDRCSWDPNKDWYCYEAGCDR
jgi:hypothetical protein